MAPRVCTIRVFLLALTAIVLCLIFKLYYISLHLPPPPPLPPETTPLDYWLWDEPSRFHYEANSTSTSDDPCAGFPIYLSTIQVVLKVGAAEPSNRLNSQISSVTKCVPNLIVFSDMNHALGPYQAHDILADLPASTRTNNPDFDIYYTQKNLFAEGTLSSTKDGWRLDRYKFLPMVERAYDMNPWARWFVFLESDTYIVWDNLFRLLDNFNPSVALYMGSPAPGRTPSDGAPKTWFAYGGTGFVLSIAAVQKLLFRAVGSHGEYTQPRLSRQYEEIVKRDSCGDSVLGWALWEKGVNLSGMWPMFNPHPLHGVPFSEKYWCQPVISMHKTFPKDMTQLWEWERGRDRRRPLLYADLIHFSGLGSFDSRADWDNADFDGFQEPDNSPAHSSFDACASACRSHASCYQYTHHLKKCTFVRSIRLGAERKPEGKGSAEETRFMAGWDTNKIGAWQQEHPCEEALWMKPSITRIF